ncbi:hypothetical protein [Kordiimonas marina]|uniref:hypothetical protein n=1 Tax=Kordiimonas marina TaxID=2872312 RepID=UPI001FF166E9|nr:hypothetical protein [Kordiimonas marina]MCJ9428696.1 hypothetical protein [Kordiimonas marina]
MSTHSLFSASGLSDVLAKMSKLFSGIADWAKAQLKGVTAKIPELLGLTGSDSSEADTKTTAKDAKNKGKDGSSEHKSPFDTLFKSIKDGVGDAVKKVKIDFNDLGGTIKNIFKAVGQSIASTLQNVLGNMISQGASSLFTGILGAIFPSAPAAAATSSAVGQPTLSSMLASVTTAATGGTIRPGQVTLVGEEGPELIVPNSMSTVLTAAQTGKMMARGAKGSAMGMAAPTAVPETKVIINNHSGGEAKASRRRGPDGGDIVDIVIGRVAQDLARGGQVADAASLRFGLTPQGT